jgi:hypothetical protein
MSQAQAARNLSVTQMRDVAIWHLMTILQINPQVTPFGCISSECFYCGSTSEHQSDCPYVAAKAFLEEMNGLPQWYSI